MSSWPPCPLQADQNSGKAMAILEPYNRKKSEIVEQTHSRYAIHALDWMFQRPIFKSSDFIRSSAIPKPTASKEARGRSKENK